MRKGSKCSEKTKAKMRESNKDSIKKALEVKLKNYKNKHPSRREHPYLYIKSRNLLRNFGILLSEYNTIYENQNGHCAICGVCQDSIKNNKSLGVDHDHKTGKIRGLLCDRCNRGIGLFGDNVYLLEKAKEYLKNYTTGFLNPIEIRKKGIIAGDNVLISDKCSIYGTEIQIGNNVRIDDFCILSGKIQLGSNIHIGAYCALYGKFGIIMEDFTGLSPRCTIFSASDDFGGDFLISPMNPIETTNVTGEVVLLKKYVQIGAGTVIMPDIVINQGAAIGAMSFVKKTIPEWEIWAGNPLRFIKERKRGMVELEKQYRDGL